MPTLKVTGKEVLGPRSTDGPAGDRYHRAPEGWAKAKREKLSGKELEPKKPRALCLKQDHIIQYIYIYISVCVAIKKHMSVVCSGRICRHVGAVKCPSIWYLKIP